MAPSTESAKSSSEVDSNVISEKDDTFGTITNSAAAIPTVTTTTNSDQVQHQQHKDVLVQSTIPDKVKIHFVAVGSAPILKRTKFQINSDQRFAAVHVFLRKLLKLSPTDHNTTSGGINSNSSNHNNLFLYCCSAFVPSPDHLVGELRDSFANVSTNELVIHYSIQEAWG